MVWAHEHKCSNPTLLHRYLATCCCVDCDGFNFPEKLKEKKIQPQLPLPGASSVTLSLLQLYISSYKTILSLKTNLFWNSMELKSSVTTAFLLFLLLLTPYISRGGSDVADSEVYEIDYRGPETHSSVMPPPGHSHGRPWIHQDTVKTSHTPQGFRGGNNGEQANKIHG